jgi:hypothetical protein
VRNHGRKRPTSSAQRPILNLRMTCVQIACDVRVTRECPTCLLPDRCGRNAGAG